MSEAGAPRRKPGENDRAENAGPERGGPKPHADLQPHRAGAGCSSSDSRMIVLPFYRRR